MPRDVVERERVAVLRALVPAAFFVPADLRVPVEEREVVAPADFARLVLALRVPVEARFVVARRVPVERDRPVERPVELAEVELAEVELSPSSVHLPESTRCAASATASAISDPSFDALETTLLAAAWAESAASSPASRILRRAAGLALIAAAAAASPAANISRLIAAFASLSRVSFPVDEPPFRLLDFAIANLPLVIAEKTLQTRNGSGPVTNWASDSKLSGAQIR